MIGRLKIGIIWVSPFQKARFREWLFFVVRKTWTTSMDPLDLYTDSFGIMLFGVGVFILWKTERPQEPFRECE